MSELRRYQRLFVARGSPSGALAIRPWWFGSGGSGPASGGEAMSYEFLGDVLRVQPDFAGAVRRAFVVRKLLTSAGER